MTLRDVASILGAEILTGEERLDEEVRTACGSDMMSEVLAFTKENSLLLTGLCNPQVMRTAEMLDLKCVVFIRGKKPSEEMIAMARNEGLVVMTVKTGMYTACGRLFASGDLPGCIN